MKSHRFDIVDQITRCQSALIANDPTPITYQDRIALESNKLPESLGKNPINVYALWVKIDANSAWRLMYIGQRSTKNGWSRVKQHLFLTPKRTQSKLAQVRAAVESGAEIGVTAIHVEPDSMRLAVEEELININSKSSQDLPWNEKARSSRLTRQ